jgi:hypothetical protein
MPTLRDNARNQQAPRARQSLQAMFHDRRTAKEMLAECEFLAPAKLLFAQAFSLTWRTQLNNIQIA